MPNKLATLVRLLSGVAVGAIITAAPVSIDFDDRDGFHGVSIQKAFAKGGDDDDGDDDSDSSGSGSGGSDDDSDDDDDSSGSGHSGDDDDDDDDDDDHDDDDDDDDDGYEDDDEDEGRGRGRGRGRGGRDDDDDHDSKPRNLMEFLGFDRDRGSIAKVESEGTSLEVEYADGWKEEIENGRYELKDPGNETVVERPATQADIDRLSSAF